MKKFLLIIIMLLMLVISPVYATGDIDGPEVIYKQKDRVLTLSQILPLYSSTAGSIVVKTDNYTGSGNIPGNYSIKLGVADSEIEKTVSINVRNSIGNVIAVTMKSNAYTIHLHKTQILTPQAIIDVLVNVQFISVSSTTQISILTNTYSDNANAPGTYIFEFHLATTSGQEEIHEINLKVNDTAQLMPDIVVEHLTFWEVVWPTIKMIITLAVLFIVGYVLISILKKKVKR